MDVTENNAPQLARAPSPTRCEARTRLYRHGVLEREGFAVADISEHAAEDGVMVWLDLLDPDLADLQVLSEEFGLHPLGSRGCRTRSAAPEGGPLRRVPVPQRL